MSTSEFVVLLMVCTSLLIPLLLITINSFIFKKHQYSREKFTPFECGFDPKTFSRTPFSLKFYLISVIFLIFDIEITILLPFPVFSKGSPINISSFLFITLISILLIGLILEWHEGALNWLY